MKVAVLGLSIMVTSLAGLAFADDAPFAKEIKARQGLMELNAMNIGILAGMAKGTTPYDAATAQAAADALVGVYKLDLAMLWPQGSDNTANPTTNALPAIWADGSDIGAKVDTWGKAAMAMQVAAATGVDGVKGALGDLGGACGGCHKAFRASN